MSIMCAVMISGNDTHFYTAATFLEKKLNFICFKST